MLGSDPLSRAIGIPVQGPRGFCWGLQGQGWSRTPGRPLGWGQQELAWVSVVEVMFLQPAPFPRGWNCDEKVPTHRERCCHSPCVDALTSLTRDG